MHALDALDERPVGRPIYYGYFKGFTPLAEPAIELFFGSDRIGFCFPMRPDEHCLILEAQPEDFEHIRQGPEAWFRTRFAAMTKASLDGLEARWAAQWEADGTYRIVNVPLTLWDVLHPQENDKIMNGLTRPFFGWVSDRIGRENTMFIAFAFEAIGILLLSQFGNDPVWFVVLSGMVFFAWGEIYSLFPSTCADTYGWKHASANAGALYTAKGTAGLFVPIAASLAISAGWHSVFLVAAAMNGVAAVMALFVLKPLRQRFIAKDTPAAPPPAQVSEGLPRMVAQKK